MLGSHTERLVNKTIGKYLRQDIAFFKKAHIPHFVRGNKFSKNYVVFKEKADIDYYGVVDGKYISFEVKETRKEYFLLSQIKPHQKEILFKLENFSALSFLLLNFITTKDTIFLIKTPELKQIYDSNKKRISLEDAKEIGVEVNLLPDGTITLLEALNLKNRC